MSERGCARCTVWKDEKGRPHHQPDCPEMRWPDGHPRGTIHPEARSRLTGRPVGEKLRPLQDPKSYPFSNPGGVNEEMAAIFGGVRKETSGGEAE